MNDLPDFELRDASNEPPAPAPPPPRPAGVWIVVAVLIAAAGAAAYIAFGWRAGRAPPAAVSTPADLSKEPSPALGGTGEPITIIKTRLREIALALGIPATHLPAR